MSPTPPSLFDQIPTIAQIFTSSRKICLLFNLDCLESNRGITSRLVRQIQWLSSKENIVPAILSHEPLEHLKVRFDSSSFVLAAEDGFEIIGPGFYWGYPELNTVRSQLQSILSELRVKYSDYFKLTTYSFSRRELWIKILINDEKAAQQIIQYFRELNHPNLKLNYKSGIIQIEPLEKWNRCQAIQKILELALRPGSPFPALIYFGGDENDEEVFETVNQYGWSVIIRSRIPLDTNAYYYIKDQSELGKFLYWLHAN